MLALVIGLSISTQEFMTLGNLTDVATSYAILGILACGPFVVLIAGGIDISFPAVTSIGQYVMASYIIHHGGSFPLAFAMSMGTGLLLGLVNGFLVYWLARSGHHHYYRHAEPVLRFAGVSHQWHLAVRIP